MFAEPRRSSLAGGVPLSSMKTSCQHGDSNVKIVGSDQSGRHFPDDLQGGKPSQQSEEGRRDEKYRRAQKKGKEEQDALNKGCLFRRGCNGKKKGRTEVQTGSETQGEKNENRPRVPQTSGDSLTARRLAGAAGFEKTGEDQHSRKDDVG